MNYNHNIIFVISHNMSRIKTIRNGLFIFANNFKL